MKIYGVAVLIASATVHMLLAHPQCLDFTAPSQAKQDQMQFCTEIIDDSNKDGACCTLNAEKKVKSRYYDAYKLSKECEPYQRQVACGECHPYSTHLIADGSGIMVLSEDFCTEYVAACHDDMNLPVNFCDLHVGNGYYKYPMNEPRAPSISPEITFSPSASSFVGDALNPLQNTMSPTTLSAEITPLEPYFQNLGELIPTQMTGMFMKPNSNFWWIINQRGQIFEVKNKRNADTTQIVMDISLQIVADGENGLGEMGLLGLAFSPDFLSTNNFYINYINTERDTTIARYTYKEGDPDGTAGTEQVLMQFYQPYENHNGGTLLFSPADIARPSGSSFYDLYIVTGDGGSANDPENRAQDLNSLFGKILRIRLSTDPDVIGYDIPEDNIRNEIWAFGFRNPWKCTFDKDLIETPEMWCGDVGQDNIEEITRIGAGMNHGWKNFEGTRYNYGKTIGYRKPVYEYCHLESIDELCIGKPFTGQSITGGYLYRGTKYAESYGGQYIFADFQLGGIHRIFEVDGVWEGAVIVNNAGIYISSFAEDNDGEIYILSYGENSNVYTLPLDALNLTTSDKEEEYDPGCENGIANGKICCPPSCGACGGYNCHLRPGGRTACCSSGVLEKGKACSSNTPPCIIEN